MPRKKKQKEELEEIEEEDEEEEESGGLLSELKEDTIRGVMAVLFFILAVFLLLSAFEMAGVVGQYTYKGLSSLLGVGYYLTPLLFFMLTVALFKDRADKKKIGLFKTIGSVLFLLSGLGLISLLLNGRGGIVGDFVSEPLVMLVDTYVTIILLIGLVVVSLLIIFDTHLRFNFPALNIFKRRENEEEEYYEEDEVEEEPEEEEEEIEEDVEEDEVEEETPKKTSKIKKMLGMEKDQGGLEIAPVIGEYTPPPINLLSKDKGKPQVGDTKANANIIKRTLQNFGIRVEMDEISVGPTVTRYSLKPAEGVRISRIVSLQSNLELALAASPIRIEAPIPGKSLVGIEVPNSSKATISLSALLKDSAFTNNPKPLMASLGRDITGKPHYADIAKMPHGLIAGTTGSGKSVTIHSLITSLLYRNGPQTLRFIMVDPKRVELTLYNDIPHLLTPVIKQPKQAILALKWAANEMDRRYNILETEKVRDIGSYHKNILAPAMKQYERKKQRLEEDGGDAEGLDMPETMPYIVIIIDELADIMQAYPRELEAAIVKLAQMSRAVGIHLVLSTQRPSVNVITGLIKANVPSRVALQVSSQIDSRTILDTGGAEKLLGAGDMLYQGGDMAKPVRIQSAFISEEEVKKVVDFLAKNNDMGLDTGIDLEAQESRGDGIFAGSISDDSDDDPKYEEAKQVVIEAGKASTSYLQRKLGVGYSRAAKLIDLLEEKGVIGPGNGSKPRDVLIAPGEEELPEEEEEEYEEDEQGEEYDDGEEEGYEEDEDEDRDGEEEEEEEYDEEEEEEDRR